MGNKFKDGMCTESLRGYKAECGVESHLLLSWFRLPQTMISYNSTVWVHTYRLRVLLKYQQIHKPLFECTNKLMQQDTNGTDLSNSPLLHEPYHLQWEGVKIKLSSA